jgi:DNA-binding GntR family transcriptional regulator
VGSAGNPSTMDTSEPLQEIIENARVQYLTVGEMVYAIIRQAIVNGVLEPGDHLRQDALAQAIGVSRLPVRSALLQLESEGLVILHPHRGFTVRELTPEQVREIYEIRCVLETHALRRAIASMTPERIGRLEQLADQLDNAESGDAFVQLSFAFYRELYDAENNPLLVSLIERLHSDVGRYWLSRRVLDREQATHAQLLEHARSGDTNAAAAWLKAHLEDVAEQLIPLISSGGG